MNLCFEFFFAEEIKKSRTKFLLNLKKRTVLICSTNSIRLICALQSMFNISNFSLIFTLWKNPKKHFFDLENLDVFSLEKYFNENIDAFYNLINKKFRKKHSQRIRRFEKKCFDSKKNPLKRSKISSPKNYISDRVKKNEKQMANLLKSDG